MITIRYMAQLRQAAGVNEETADTLSPVSAATMLKQLAQRHAEAFQRIVFDDHGQVRPSILVFLGDQQISPDAEQILRDGDVLTVMAPMAGG